MKTVLKHLRSGKFLDDSGEWSTGTKHALNFRSVTAARDYCQNHRCEGAAIILKFDSSKHDIVLKSS